MLYLLLYLTAAAEEYSILLKIIRPAIHCQSGRKYLMLGTLWEKIPNYKY